MIAGDTYSSPELNFGFGKRSIPVVPAETQRCPRLDGERRGDREGDHPVVYNDWLVRQAGPAAPRLLECGCGGVFALAPPAPPPAPELVAEPPAAVDPPAVEPPAVVDSPLPPDPDPTDSALAPAPDQSPALDPNVEQPEGAEAGPETGQA